MFAVWSNVTDESATNHPLMPEWQTFNSRKIDAGMFMNPNPIPDDPERALLKGTRACNQLWKEETVIIIFCQRVTDINLI